MVIGFEIVQQGCERTMESSSLSARAPRDEGAPGADADETYIRRITPRSMHSRLRT